MTNRNPTLAQWTAEVYRLRLMRDLEERLSDAGYPRIAGVDEVGRGALAGPVAAGAVVVAAEETIVPGVDDSKTISPIKRARLAAHIRRAHPNHAVAMVPPAEIDRINILQATRRAMRQALNQLDPQPTAALVDAVALRDLPFPSIPVVRGDQISYAIACASIVAKVERDQLMVDLDSHYPAYGFAQHKGYGSAAHRQAIAEHGACAAHRMSFGSLRTAKSSRLARSNG